MNGIPGRFAFSQEAVAAPDGGLWVMAQSSAGSAAGLINDNVYVRRFDEDLQPLTDFARVSRPKEGTQGDGAIAVGPAGQAVASYTDDSKGSEAITLFPELDLQFDTISRNFDAHRVLLNEDGSVGQTSRPVHFDFEQALGIGPHPSNAGAQRAGQPAILNDGTVVIPYFDITVGQIPGTNRVQTQPSISVSLDRREIDVFASSVFNGGPAAAPFPNAIDLPKAVALEGGGFAVSWTMVVRDEGLSLTALFASVFDASGGTVGGPVRISPIGTSVTSGTELVAMGTGGLAVIYNMRDTFSGLATNVVATTLSGEGVKGDLHEVANGAGTQFLLSTAPSPDGSILATYLDGAGTFTERLVFDDGQSAVFTGDATGEVYRGRSIKDWVDMEGGNDFVRLNAGNDRGHGGDGNDTVRGGDGHDLITGGRGRDNLLGERGNDTVSGGAGSDTILGGSFADTLDGGANNDLLRGQQGNDLMKGGNGNDTLIGAAGNDTLDGGAGFDVMNGGAGADTFVLRRTGVQSDEIRGFQLGIDKISIDGDDLTGIEVINAGRNTVIELGTGVEAVLIGVTATLSELDLQLI